MATDGATQLLPGCDILELNSFSHGYGQITYHIILVPKYRYKIFYSKQIKKDFELILNSICIEKGYKMHAMEIVEDHVHLFLEFHPNNSLSEVIQNLKGGSSYRLFKLHPKLKKQYWGGNLWSKEKYIGLLETLQPIQLNIILKSHRINQK